jgi:hypothetical protein
MASEASDQHRISRAADDGACLQLEVRKSGALIGHIRCDEKGFYQYYRGPLNQLIYEFEDDDLDRLKQRVAAREETSPLTY